jgi:hypothetical protein
MRMQNMITTHGIITTAAVLKLANPDICFHQLWHALQQGSPEVHFLQPQRNPNLVAVIRIISEHAGSLDFPTQDSLRSRGSDTSIRLWALAWSSAARRGGGFCKYMSESGCIPMLTRSALT